MKNILTTLLVLFALVVNAQSDTTKCDCTYLTTKPMYHYYIVFEHTTDTQFGMGYWEFILNKKIEDISTIDNISCCLKKNSKFTKVIITNWILLKTVQPNKK